ncbi:hypothetical protein DPMN_085442 [Dreissena polymorpha]|uniref:Uncharacterized protein n=1 Tax=Dreissena polymorpha TaxID=45954 RepID=A0A9D4BJF9_DREPO|nr:hypothetical protein DPMN_085442 [Dreissena polymorpha]
MLVSGISSSGCMLVLSIGFNPDSRLNKIHHMEHRLVDIPWFLVVLDLELHLLVNQPIEESSH